MNTETTGAQTAPGAAPQGETQGETQGGIQYGGFWLRAAAYLLDNFIIIVPWFIVHLILTFGLAAGVDTLNSLADPGAALLIGLLVWFLVSALAFAAYFIVFPCTKWQATPGKYIVGLKITDAEGNKISFGRSLGRFLGSLISYFILHIGYIMIGFTDRKRGLHDMMAGTLVVKR